MHLHIQYTNENAPTTMMPTNNENVQQNEIHTMLITMANKNVEIKTCLQKQRNLTLRRRKKTNNSRALTFAHSCHIILYVTFHSNGYRVRERVQDILCDIILRRIKS